MKQYLELLRDVRLNGVFKGDRTGTGTYSVFGRQMRFNLANGFPLVTTKQCHLKSIIHELLWFLRGETNIRYLKENGVSIWDEWVLPGTEEYRTLELRERSALLAKKAEAEKSDALQEWTDHIMQVRPINLLNSEDLPPLTAEQLEAHHAFLDKYDIPRQVLVAGELGPVYGAQWRSWPAPDGRVIDQITKAVELLKTNPDSRRIIVSAWNPALVDEMALPPCHTLFQFYTRPRAFADIMTDIIDWPDTADGEDVHELFEKEFADLRSGVQKEPNWIKAETRLSWRHPDYYNRGLAFAERHGIPTRYLDCQLLMRSNDIFLGWPFNIASYALLTLMMAQVVNMLPGEFVWTGGDVHLYSNHLEQADLQLSRKPYPLPTMRLNPAVKDIFAFCFEDFTLENYECHPPIKAPVAV